MLYREIILICSQIHTKHINTLCGQNVELLNVKPGGKQDNHWTLKELKCLAVFPFKSSLLVAKVSSHIAYSNRRFHVTFLIIFRVLKSRSFGG